MRQGFQIATSPEMTLATGQGATRDLSLALAGATDFVSVEGVARAGYRADTCLARTARIDTAPRHAVHRERAAERVDRQRPGEELQRGVEVSAARRISGDAGIGDPASRHARHAGQQHAERPHGRHGHRRHRRQQHGVAAADRSAERARRRAVWTGESVGHVQLRAEASDRSAGTPHVAQLRRQLDRDRAGGLRRTRGTGPRCSAIA